MDKSEPTVEEIDAALAKAIAADREVHILESYRDRKLTRGRAARMLGLSERQVNRRMKDLGFDRGEGVRARIDRAAQEKRELRQNAAQLAKSGKITVEQAALRAGCSIRTIYRYMDE